MYSNDSNNTFIEETLKKEEKEKEICTRTAQLMQKATTQSATRNQGVKS